MDGALLLVTLGALASKFVDFVKYLRARDVNAVITQLAVWVAGILVMVFAAASDVFNTMVIPGTGLTFGQLDTGTLIFLGLNAASFLSVAVDFRKSFDNTDTAQTPTLTGIGSKGPDA